MSRHVETPADPRNSQAERRKLDEDIAKIDHSDFEEEAISSFKRIRFGDWVPSRQMESYETTEDDSMENVPSEQWLTEYEITPVLVRRRTNRNKQAMLNYGKKFAPRLETLQSIKKQRDAMLPERP